MLSDYEGHSVMHVFLTPEEFCLVPELLISPTTGELVCQSTLSTLITIDQKAEIEFSIVASKHLSSE